MFAAFFVWSAGISSAQAHGTSSSKPPDAVHSQDYDKAIEALKSALDDDPFNEKAKENLASVYRARGWAFYASGDFEKGIGDFRWASRLERDKNADTYLGLGYGSYSLRNNDDALYYLYDEVYLAPDDWRGHDLIGAIYYQRGKLAESIDEWEMALRLMPENAGLKERLAKAKKEFQVEGSFSKTDTYYFNIKYEGEEKRELGELVLDILDSAYRDVGSDLDYYPREPIAVILYTREQFSDVTDAPSWSSGIFDGNIRVPVGGSVDKMVLTAILYHEYAHAVTNMIAGHNIPTWVAEGVAMYEERHVHDMSQGIKGGKIIPLSSLAGPFMGMSGDEASLAYAESYSAVNFLVDRFGSYNLAKLLKLLGRGQSIEDAVHECTGISFDDFQRYWIVGISG